MNENVIFADFANTDLINFHYHTNPDDYSDSFIELFLQNRVGKTRHLRFNHVSNVVIESGFSGYLGGMEIIDISHRQWASALIEVGNFEQDPGIKFLAMSMDILVDELNT